MRKKYILHIFVLKYKMQMQKINKKYKYLMNLVKY